MRADLSGLTEEEKKQYKRAYMIVFREVNADKIRERQRRYSESHREIIRQRARDYYWKHAERIKADAIRTGKVLRVKQRLAVLYHYSGGTMSCVQCGFSDIRALVLDHINGGGTEHRRVARAGGNVWLWLARHGFPPGYQILCANCNAIKAREEGEYASNSKIGSDWRSQFVWKKQIKEIGLHDRGQEWELPAEMKARLLESLT